MKKLTVRSHEADAPIILPSGDKYDSQATLIENGELLMTFLMNVDSGAIRKDGKIEILNGVYQIRCESHKRLGKVLRVTLNGSGILPTIQPNTRHKGKKIAEGILIHKGGRNSDNSAGCLTMPPDNYDRFISFWDFGETGILEKI